MFRKSWKILLFIFLIGILITLIFVFRNNKNVLNEKVLTFSGIVDEVTATKVTVKPDDTKELQRVMTEINGKGYDFSSASIDKALAEIELEITEETRDYQYALGDVAADEEVWQSKYDSEQTTNQMLQTNIENFQAMVQNNIAESHTYGYND